jgi:hypothetical protein
VEATACGLSVKAATDAPTPLASSEGTSQYSDTASASSAQRAVAAASTRQAAPSTSRA